MQFPLRPFSALMSILFCLGTWCSGLTTGTSATSSERGARSRTGSPPREETVAIPGPLPAFLRMAGISREVAPRDVLPLLARNVELRGYEGGLQTEFLLLLERYVAFARDLEHLSGGSRTLHVTGCENAMELVHVLGYQFHQACGERNGYLVTENAERAFLTVDSGFPLTELEDCLRRHRPFSYAFPSTEVPVLFRPRDWMELSWMRRKGGNDVLDVLLHDAAVDRLYWAFSKLDDETRTELYQTPGLRALLAEGAELDFYGSQINIRSGRMELPGGAKAEHSWESLVGGSAKYGGDFAAKLLGEERGWLGAYFDAMARASREQQARLTADGRLKRLYAAYREAADEYSATHGVFPRNARLVMLFDSVHWNAAGEPLVPGSFNTWDEILNRKDTPRVVRQWGRKGKLQKPEQVLEAMVACSQVDTNDGPLEIYMTLSAVAAARGPEHPLEDETVREMAANYAELHSWYAIFAEFPQLNDGSIRMFVKTAMDLDAVEGPTLRSNALGGMQANLGLWEILARQGQIAEGKMNASWQAAVEPFREISTSVGLFEKTKSSLEAVITAAGGSDVSEDTIIDLLAGPPQASPAGQQVHEELAARMHAVLTDQRLASLDTLFGLYDGLHAMAHGTAEGAQLLPLAGRLHEFELPRPIFSESERIAWAPQIYTSRHAELQVRTDLTRVIRLPGTPSQLEAARGQLAPFLRDTLVGLNYAYYEPPGAQVLHHNPLFVRAHDFSGGSILGYMNHWDSPQLVGIGVTAGGGAYLIGSLSNLAYALATAEQDFIAPVNVQALIWQSAVPALLVDAVQPRWWGVSEAELHAVGLYQKAGEELLEAAASHAELREQVLHILSDSMTPERLENAAGALRDPGDVGALLGEIYPSETFYLEAEYRKEHPADAGAWGPAGKELEALAEKDGAAVSEERIAHDFGVPHPILEQSTACTILDVKPFPAYGGEPNRLLGESWESSNLYWARLADEMGYPPVALNVLIPDLTRVMVANIFATDLADWPALQRAMLRTGREFREGRIRIPAISNLVQR